MSTTMAWGRSTTIRVNKRVVKGKMKGLNFMQLVSLRWGTDIKQSGVGKIIVWVKFRFFFPGTQTAKRFHSTYSKRDDSGAVGALWTNKKYNNTRYKWVVLDYRLAHIAKEEKLVGAHSPFSKRFNIAAIKHLHNALIHDNNLLLSVWYLSHLLILLIRLPALQHLKN